MDVSTNGSRANHLLGQRSPYLQQHQYNPVDWYPWGEEAFLKARQERKPIFLSIGYSTCHWCHVMAHESFEDSDVAQLMNNAFVCVKVDREERPDIDKAYMEVAQTMAGSAGWPLTIIMTPDKEPFYAATYIPKESHHGQIGMLQLVPTIQRIWIDDRARIQEVVEQSRAALEKEAGGEPGYDLTDDLLDQAFDRFSDSFDDKMGGFGRAPKFPSPHNLIFLLRYWNRTHDELALHMTKKTLTATRLGGIYDHVGFGFHRYSTDSRWLVPHFEKMLYDQAMHILAYTEAYQATKEALFAEVVDEIVTYLKRDMMSPDGAFYAAEDADSEGREGKFYTWSYDDLVGFLSDDELRVAQMVWEVSQQGNYSDEATGEQTGLNILHMTRPKGELASALGMSEQLFTDRLESTRRKILSERSKRVRPHRDEKMLCDWNGLLVAALSRAGVVMKKNEYLELAEKTAHFILEKMRPQGRLMHSFREGVATVEAFLDDYSFLTWGLLELYFGTFKPKYLRLAKELVETTIDLFEDAHAGAFFFSGKDSEQMIVRRKDAYDGALPSGNSAAMLNLVRLARILGDSSLEDKAVRLARVFSKQVGANPSGFTMMLAALNHLLGPSREVVIAGDPEQADTKQMLDALREAYVPNLVIILRGDEESSEEISRLAPYTKYYDRLDNRATAHVCIERNCRLPTSDPATMMKQVLA